MQKKAAELELGRQKMVMEDDRKRDELEAEIRIKAEELKAKYGTQLDVAQIRSEMAINREVMKAQADIITEAARED
jgi:flagellar biosynthesis component FlhA